MYLRIAVTAFITIFLTSCLTYYQANLTFHQDYESGNFDSAEKTLAKSKLAKEKRNKFLFLMNMGIVNSVIGDYRRSNQYLEEAFTYSEENNKNYLSEVGAYLLNPTITVYNGEDFERIYIHYYKALNYLKMNDKEAALVECKRMDNKLLDLSEKYSDSTKFKQDAFINTLMGIIYEANKDYNNSFIAYRNAVMIYENDYKEFFNMEVPEQLKKDLLRSCAKMGFNADLEYFEERFKMKYEPENESDADLVFLWHNGLSPVKDQWSFGFSVTSNNGTYYVNDAGEGLSFTYYSSSLSPDVLSSLAGMSSFKISFPKYVERPLVYKEAYILQGNDAFPLSLVEDVNKVAFKSLRQRMVLEFSKALLRAAVKKTIAEATKKEDKTAGLILDIFNMASEAADTRSVHIFPHSIYYTRVPVSSGKQSLQFISKSNYGDRNVNINIEAEKGNTIFYTHYSLDAAK